MAGRPPKLIPAAKPLQVDTDGLFRALKEGIEEDDPEQVLDSSNRCKWFVVLNLVNLC